MVTLTDVARAAGVSTMTVSNVLNDRLNVRPETRERVLEAVARLDYRVNVAARNLRQGRTGTIAFAIPELSRPYFGQLAELVADAAEPLGYHLVLERTGGGAEAELATLRRSRNHLYDGLIFSVTGLGAPDVEKVRADVPLVLLGERIFSSSVDHIAMPNVVGAEAATALLLESGCRRVAMVTGPPMGRGDDVITLRRDGFRRALDAAGVPYDPRLVVEVEMSMDGAARAAEDLVRDVPDLDGVFAVTDTVALGVLRGLVDAGRRVPQDVKVVGYDGIDEGRFSVPSLSTLAPDLAWTARTAVRLLHDRINDVAPAEPVELTAPFTLVARESTARRLRRGVRRPA